MKKDEKSNTEPENAQVVVLNDEELKLVPEKEKATYMEMKRSHPSIAEQILVEYKSKKQETEQPEEKEQVKIITSEEYLIWQNNQIIAKLEELKALLEKK